jgi:hypothetical protein
MAAACLGTPRHALRTYGGFAIGGKEGGRPEFRPGTHCSVKREADHFAFSCIGEHHRLDNLIDGPA